MNGKSASSRLPVPKDPYQAFRASRSEMSPSAPKAPQRHSLWPRIRSIASDKSQSVDSNRGGSRFISSSSESRAAWRGEPSPRDSGLSRESQ